MSAIDNYLAIPGQKIQLIEHADNNAGFFALVTYALNGVRKAIDNGHAPVVNFTGVNGRHFYQAEYGENVWSYYFAPVAGLAWEQVERELLSGSLGEDDLVRFDRREFIGWHHNDPDRIATFWARDVPEKPGEWMRRKRSLGRRFVSDYLQVLPHITEKVDQFAEQHFPADVFAVGAHVRGTDFDYAEPTPVESYIRAAREILEAEGPSKYTIFVATDQEQLVEPFSEAFGSNLVVSEATRSTSDIAPFKMETISPYTRGEEVLVDALLLARCQHILKGAAAVGEYATWFNPTCKVTDFSLQSRFDRRKGPHRSSAYWKLDLGNHGALRVWRRLLSDRLLRCKHRVQKITAKKYRQLKRLWKNGRH